MKPDMPRRLANALAAACCIDVADDGLVWLLGSGTEPDNLAALEHWVRRQLLAPEEALATVILNQLVDRLDDCLLSAGRYGQYGR